MTKTEFLEFLKTDPIFKVADKQVVATLYESPFDNVTMDEETEDPTVTYHGESFTLVSDDPDWMEVLEENPFLGLIVYAKRIVISAGFRSSGGSYMVMADDNDITENAMIMFSAPADGGDSGDGGDDGGIH